MLRISCKIDGMPRIVVALTPEKKKAEAILNEVKRRLETIEKIDNKLTSYALKVWDMSGEKMLGCIAGKMAAAPVEEWIAEDEMMAECDKHLRDGRIGVL